MSREELEASRRIGAASERDVGGPATWTRALKEKRREEMAEGEAG